MSDNEKIEVGDIVDVCFSGGELIHLATVLYTPAATGDSWRIRSYDGGTITYVQQFETMTLIRKGYDKRIEKGGD